MLSPVYKNKFEKDLKRVLKRGKSTNKIKTVMKMIMQGEPLPQKYCDHQLKGDYTDCRECHIEPDWLLIYMVYNDEVIFVRTGSHSDYLNKF